MRHRLEYALLRTIGFVASLCPKRVSWGAAGVLSWCISFAAPHRVKIAVDNIRAAYPDMNDAHIRGMARDSIRHLLQTVFELPALARASRRQVEHAVEIANVGSAKDLVARYGKVIFVSAHYGNWELAALSGAMQVGTPFTIVGKKQRNPHIDAYLNRMRERFGNRMIPMEGAVRSLFRVLSGGGSVGILADQSGDATDPFVPFFGRPASTTKVVAALSLRLNVPIVIGLARRTSDLKFALEFIEVDRSGLTGTNEEQVVMLTARHVAVLESMIRQCPEQWLWMHRRWKYQDHATSA